MDAQRIHVSNPYKLETGSIKEPDQMMLERFFPRSIKWLSSFVNTVHHIHPRTSYHLTMKTLSISIRKKVSKSDLAFYRKGIKETVICKKKKFHLYKYGTGPEVLLIHGWCSSGARWKTYVDQLVAKGFCAVVMDAPAHGTSPGLFLSIPDYIAALQCVINRSKDLYGIISHSIGALCSTIALNQSLRNKEYKLVMMSTFNSCQALMEKFSRCIGIKEDIISEIKDWIPRYAGNDISYFMISEHLKWLQSEILLIYDRQDIVVPSKEVITILDEIPHIDYYSTFGLGHGLYGKEIREKVMDFIT
ncbi:MAG: alpha/beta hydrolase [Saprospiraceae bacterium]|nr:alpha/beta hydrolase [Saprospiraceae bacterium]